MLVGMVALLIVGTVAALVFKNLDSKKDTPKVQGAISPQKPDFETVLPAKDTEDIKVKFDPTKRVASACRIAWMFIKIGQHGFHNPRVTRGSGIIIKIYFMKRH